MQVARRAAVKYDSSNMGGILAPLARKPMAKNYHMNNLRQMHQVEAQLQRKRESLISQQEQEGRQQSQWKMRRFQSVESKLGKQLQMARGGNQDSVDNSP